ncbi:TonB family protein [Paraburkholderia sp. J76]|uniref:TonB family protein n=1 Tax=Paraburkholderia sp. J76 TaxID=2805439 RepID=UPI002ABD6670|nr:TonB family protein [Paraburkholderia sp. J76]
MLICVQWSCGPSATRAFLARRLGLPVLFAILGCLGACTITPPPKPLVAIPPAAINSVTLDDYRTTVAKHIVARSPSYVLHGTPQAMLRSLVVVSFTVNRNGQIVKSSVYRTNGDDEAEATALATLRRAAPLPPPPGRLLNSAGQLEMFEDWLFNDNGKFQLRTLATPQAQNFQ